ncbi:hypothetical protein ACEWAY_23450, partial [Vibrio parahaemolyticus]
VPIGIFKYTYTKFGSPLGKKGLGLFLRTNKMSEIGNNKNKPTKNQLGLLPTNIQRNSFSYLLIKPGNTRSWK